MIELDDGSRQWLDMNEIHQLLASDEKFMDVTSHPDPIYPSSLAPVKFPSDLTQGDVFEKLVKHIDSSLLKTNLAQFSDFHTRFCRSELGLISSLWLYDLVEETGITHSDVFSVELFNHDLAQKSIIARFEGSVDPESIVIIGAHLDSINLSDYYDGRAPGADDNGSGSVTILEVLRLLVMNKFKPRNTVEFHWYAAEEIGLIGSQDVFAAYHAAGKNVKAMIQQDMTGGTNRDRGVPDDFGLIEDFVDPELTTFVKKVIDTYADIPWTSKTCGYACSDHASAYKYGYPSSFIIEYGTSAAIPDPGPRVGHNELDTVDRIDFTHMVQHVKLTLGAALELGVTDF